MGRKDFKFLDVGRMQDGAPFILPADLGDRKIALLAQSNKGKTYGLGCFLEELAEVQRPFIAIDPANNLWGLRVLPDGTPSDLQIVIFGGDHADLPFEKDHGERLAELLLETPVCAVIDISFESANAVRQFMGAFAGRLMRSKPDVPRVIVLEEAPVLIPQKAFGVAAQVCKTAVAKLATIGGNFGYGVIPASQRAATIDKDVLSQCDALIVMGMTHRKDRATVQEWMEAKDVDERARKAFDELGSLRPGEAWYWSPGEDRFERFTFRKRRTLHPREIRKLGLNSSNVQLGDMTAFVELARRELTKTVASVPGPKAPKSDDRPVVKIHDSERFQLVAENENLKAKVQDLHQRLSQATSKIQDAERRLTGVREALRPQYDALRGLFETIGISGSADRSRYLKWLEKAPKVGMRTMLEHLIEHGEATRQQLSTIAGVARSTSYDYIGWLVRNQLAEDDGSKIILRKV